MLLSNEITVKKKNERLLWYKRNKTAWVQITWVPILDDVPEFSKAVCM